LALDADKRPIGQIRYQIEGAEAVISINLAPNQRGQGYGSEVIWQASQRAFEQTAINLIHAYIKTNNTASIRAFTKAGFVKSDVTQVQEQLALHFILRKDELQ
jgi:RimJ/RimL family protein N-acetyltransferase